jgi:SpoVK/Ycf46/Vps4 family AAA+-type ATPase
MYKVLLYRSPDYGKAVEAAEKIFELLNRKPMIDNESNDGDKIVSKYYRTHFHNASSSLA